MQSQLIDIRCEEEVRDKKTGKLVINPETQAPYKCNSHIANLSSLSVEVKCRRCGRTHIITRGYKRPGDKKINWEHQIIPPGDYAEESKIGE